MYANPEQYGGTEYGILLTTSDSVVVKKECDIFASDHEYQADGVHEMCEGVYPGPSVLAPPEVPHAYIALRDYLLANLN